MRTPPARAAAPGATAPMPDEPAGRSGRKRVPNHKQQLKHALTVNAAHVITIDYLTLSQPLSQVRAPASHTPRIPRYWTVRIWSNPTLPGPTPRLPEQVLRDTSK